jgi:hypothetical protein
MTTNLRAPKQGEATASPAGQERETAVVVNFPTRPTASRSHPDVDNERLLLSIKQRLRQLEHWRVYGVRVEPPSLANALEAYVEASVRFLRTRIAEIEALTQQLRSQGAGKPN